MTRLIARWLVLVPLLLNRTPAHAESTFRSGPAPVSLIELYTSEGCASCPPAEKWLAGLRDDPRLWRDFVPVAFHVNYWDKLGWRDALATKAFTDREYAYAAAWHADSVYTPCFVRDGAEWRPPAGRVGTQAPGSTGTLTLARQKDEAWRVDYAPAPSMTRNAAASYDVFVALLGGGIVSHVGAGENSGRELRHEFVALRLEHSALAPGEDNQLSATLKLTPRTDVALSRRAIAAWVTRRGELTPLQAAGGWIE